MKKSIALFFILFFSIYINAYSFSVKSIFPTKDSIVVKTTFEKPTNDALQALANMKIATTEKLIGRKLTFKEKIALTILKLKIKNGLRRPDETKLKEGIKARNLGILSIVLVLFFTPAGIVLAILAINKANKALKQNPEDYEAKTGRILGIVSLGIALLLAIAIVLVLAFFLFRI